MMALSGQLPELNQNEIDHLILCAIRHLIHTGFFYAGTEPGTVRSWNEWQVMTAWPDIPFDPVSLIPDHPVRPVVKTLHVTWTQVALLGKGREAAWAQEASRNRSDGFSMVTIVLGNTLFISETLAPMTASCPITVSPPRIVAFA